MDIDGLDLKRLQAFYLVAKHGSLRVAALRLNQTIPAISTRLKRLEEELGVSLFERLPNRLVLTQVGTQFLAEAEGLLDRAKQALLTLNSASTSPRGRISISTGFDHAWYFAPRIGKFLKSHPEAELYMSVMKAADALRALLAGDLDISVGIFPKVPKTLKKDVIVDTTLSLVCQPGDPLLRSWPPSIPEVLRRTLILFPGHSDTRKTVEKGLSAGRNRHQSVIEVASCQTAGTFVEMGIGVGIVHSLCVGHAHPQNVRWVELGPQFGTIPFCAVYRRGIKPSPLMRALMLELTS
jgi:DNA-binding transcriptional LysR family regulator